MFYVNVWNIRNKGLELVTSLLEGKYYMIAVSVSWLDISRRDFLTIYLIPGYTLFNGDRGNKVGGYVWLFVKAHLNPIEKSVVVENVDFIFGEIKGM